MSTKIKERLKRMMIELENEERTMLDRGIEAYSGKNCDEAIEMLSDDQVRKIVEGIKKKRKKKLEVPECVL